MPWKPKKPCAFQGCPELTSGRFCEKHQKEENKRYEKYQRNPETAQRYGTQWRKIRALHVKSHPFCQECMKHDKFTRVEEVHHIVPLSQGGTHAHDNLMSLCKSCHSKISVADGDRWGTKNR